MNFPDEIAVEDALPILKEWKVAGCTFRIVRPKNKPVALMLVAFPDGSDEGVGYWLHDGGMSKRIESVEVVETVYRIEFPKWLEFLK